MSTRGCPLFTPHLCPRYALQMDTELLRRMPTEPQMTVAAALGVAKDSALYRYRTLIAKAPLIAAAWAVAARWHGCDADAASMSTCKSQLWEWLRSSYSALPEVVSCFGCQPCWAMHLS